MKKNINVKKILLKEVDYYIDQINRTNHISHSKQKKQRKDIIHADCINNINQSNKIFSNLSFDFPLNKVVWVSSLQENVNSLLLKILAGLDRPHKGDYFINELNINKMSFEEFAPYRLNIGYSFDMGGLISNQSIFENLMLPIKYHKLIPINEGEIKINEILRYFKMDHIMHERPAMVPGAYRKAACVIRALVLDPEVLLLDHPTEGFNRSMLINLVDFINEGRKLGKFKHIFITTNDIRCIEEFEKKIESTEIQLEKGKIFFK